MIIDGKGDRLLLPASHQRRIERTYDAEVVKFIVHESSFFLKKEIPWCYQFA